MNQRVTLNRALSKLGYGSRTQALDWIRNGLVKVDGKTCTNPLEWVDLKLQDIELKDTQKPKQNTIALLLH